ncbi:carboxypeptidase-like regulatory domain-containing protein [Hyalangium gracile]|uniref:carboxypeptidase-like regulatory domain-containing protein n=1 Tax=Hyalangium gracile TaxID=394092 RepID=UPI001CCA69CB|nr:carboxypeptidase-like regulatory domain-containing protein [Hyalangium gracile]
MRKVIIAATALLVVGAVLLFLRSLGGSGASADRGIAATVEPREAGSSTGRADARRYRERPEDVGVRGTADAGSTPSLVEPPSEEDGVLELEVLAGGQPVPGASARLYWRGARDPNLNEVSWRLASTGLTNAQGRARLASRPGNYLVAVRAPGYGSLLRDVTRPFGEARTLLRLTLERGQSLTGRTVVHGTKEPLPLVELVLTAHGRMVEPWQRIEAPTEERVHTASDERGSFRVEGLAPGDYQLEARAPGHTLAVLRRVKVPTAGPLTVELKAAGVIEGFVVDAQGHPAAGAEVLVSGRVPEVTTTGAGGGFSVEVEAGEHTVSARRGTEAGALEQALIVSAGKTVRDVRIQLGPSAVLKGLVVARGTGAPVAGARVDVSPYGSSGDCGRAVTDDTGHFAVEHLAPGSYDVVVTAPGFAPLSRRALTVASGEHFSIELHLTGTGAVEGQVRDGAGQPIAGAQVLRTDLWGGSAEESPGEARTDAEGRYRLEGMPVGSSNLTARREGASLGVSQLVDVTEGQTTRADFTLEEMGTVEGRVRAVSGSLPDEPLVVVALVRSKSFRPADLRPIEVDESGSFRMTLPPGRYELRARHAELRGNGISEPEPVDVTARETARVELLWFGEAREKDRLRGVVLEPDGTPSPGAYVMVFPEGEPHATRQGTVADEQGHFSLSPPVQAAERDMRLRLLARSGGRMGELQGVKAGEQTLVVKLRPGASLRGRVVRAGGGEPVKGFTMTLQAQDVMSFPMGNGTWEFPGDRFELRDVPAEPVRVLVRTTDGAGGNALITPAPGVVTELEVPLKGTASVRGRVVDAVSLAPVGGALVFILEDRPMDPDKATAADGSFTLEGVAAGQRILLVVSGQDVERVPVTLEEGQAADVGDILLGKRE